MTFILPCDSRFPSDKGGSSGQWVHGPSQRSSVKSLFSLPQMMVNIAYMSHYVPICHCMERIDIFGQFGPSKTSYVAPPKNTVGYALDVVLDTLRNDISSCIRKNVKLYSVTFYVCDWEYLLCNVRCALRQISSLNDAAFDMDKKHMLTRAPLGYCYNAPHGGGGYFEPPPLWSPKLLDRF